MKLAIDIGNTSVTIGLFDDDQLQRLQKFKSDRNQDNVVISLRKLEASLNNNDNLLPIIIKCIKNNCTLGEICEVMRKIHGEYL